MNRLEYVGNLAFGLQTPIFRLYFAYFCISDQRVCNEK